MLLGFLHILRSWFTDIFLNHATIFDRLCMMQRCLIFPTSRCAAWSPLHHALPFPGWLSLCGHLLTTSLHSISGRHYWFDKHTHILYIYICAAISTTSWPRTSWSRWLRDSLAASALVEWRNVLTSCLVELAIALWEPWMAMEALPEPQLGRDNRRLHHLVCKTWWSCFSTCQWFCKCWRAMI